MSDLIKIEPRTDFGKYAGQSIETVIAWKLGSELRSERRDRSKLVLHTRIIDDADSDVRFVVASHSPYSDVPTSYQAFSADGVWLRGFDCFSSRDRFDGGQVILTFGGKSPAKVRLG